MAQFVCHGIRIIKGMVLFMRKNILILGPSRAGKTTLTKKLNEALNYSVVCFDSIIYAFEQSFPQLGICSGDGAENTAANLADFLTHYFDMLSYRSNEKNGIKFAAEGGYFDFEKIMLAMNNYEMTKDFLFIGLVYNNKTPDELFEDIRKNDTEGDWSYNCDDDALKKCVNIFIEDSSRMYDKFQKHNFMIYDVSDNREQVLNRIVNDVSIIFNQ
jgi:GTPase SAR1 family protein